MIEGLPSGYSPKKEDATPGIEGLPSGYRVKPNAFMSGLAGKEEQSGFSLANAAETLGQGAGPMIGSAVGMFAGPGGTVLGAAAGKAAQNAYQASQGQRAPGLANAAGAIASPAVEAVTQYTGEKYLGPVMGKVGEGLGKVGKSFASTMSGVGRDFLDRVAERPFQVLKKMGEGVLGVEADSMREALKATAGTASQLYDDVIQAVLTHKKYGPGWRYPVGDSLSPVFDKARKDFGFGVPTRFGPATGEAEIFNDIANVAREIGWGTAEQVYNFQKDLNAKIAQHSGTPLGAALMRVKSAVRDGLGRSVPEIGQANRIYATLKPLEDFAEGAANKENIVQFLRTASKDNTRKSANELANLAAEFPKVGKQLDTLLDSMAGAAVAPMVPDQLVRTGLTGAVISGLGTLNPAAYAAVPFMSPRLAGLATAYGSRLGTAIGPRGSEIIGGQVNRSSLDALKRSYNQRRLGAP